MTNSYLKKTVLEVVDNQIAADNPPCTKAIYEKLLELGYTRMEAKENIAAILLTEIYDVLKSGKTYNDQRYQRNLEAMLKQAEAKSK